MRYKYHFTALVALILFMPFQAIRAEGGFGVSGNFSSYSYKMVPGETLFTPDVSVLFFNNYDHPITVELLPTLTNADGSPTTVEDRIRFIIDDSTITIPAESTLEVPLGIELDESAPAGEYLIGLSAEVVPDSVDGIAVTGSAELQTELTVFGEAGDISIQTLDMFDAELPVELSVFRDDEDGLFSVGSSFDGTFADRKIPGDYYVVARYKDTEVARQAFKIIDGEVTTIELVAQTVFISELTLTPVFDDTTGTLLDARLDYTMINIHTIVDDIRIILVATYDDTPFYESEVALVPFLPEDEFTDQLSFTPELDWQVGTYSFQLVAYQGEFDREDAFLIGESDRRDLRVLDHYIIGDNPSLWQSIDAFFTPLNTAIASGVLVVLIITGSVIVWQNRK